MILYIDIGWALSTNWKWDGDLSEGGSKLYIPSNLNISKRCSPKPFGQTENGLVSGRLACTSSKTEILNKIGI